MSSSNLRDPECAAIIPILVQFNPHGLTSSLEGTGVFKMIPVVSSAHGAACPMRRGVPCWVFGANRFRFKKTPAYEGPTWTKSKCVKYVRPGISLGSVLLPHFCSDEDYLRIHFRRDPKRRWLTFWSPRNI